MEIIVVVNNATPNYTLKLTPHIKESDIKTFRTKILKF